MDFDKPVYVTQPDLPPLDHLIPQADLEKLSTLQLLDIISHKLLVQGSVPGDMTLLRRRIEEMEEAKVMLSEAQIAAALKRAKAQQREMGGDDQPHTNGTGTLHLSENFQPTPANDRHTAQNEGE